jgi:endonuclease/exonuclease/phosphatase (EEP) superfamily protein YafD
MTASSSDRPPRGSAGRRATRALGGLLVIGFGLVAVPLLVLLAVPPLQAVDRMWAFMACAIPYLSFLLIGASLGLLLVLGGRKRLVAVALVVVATAVASGPWWRFPTPATPQPTTDDLTVVSLNTQFGLADRATILRLAASADLLAFQENIPELVSWLEEDGLSHDFPYRLGTAAYGASGTMVWSRTPITLAASGRTQFTSLVVRTSVRGTDWTVSTLHAVSPLDGSRVWEADAAAVADLLRPYASEHLVVVGDFNAVDQHVTMQRVRAVGLEDSMDGWPLAAGDGWQASWPTHPRVPPLIRIDHALHSASVAAWRPQYVEVAGTDHRAVVAIFRAREVSVR